jgi:hypothetical protein
MNEEEREEFNEKLREHAQAVEAKLRNMLRDRYGVDDPLEVTIAIKNKKLLYYEFTDLPMNIFRVRVYTYGGEYMFTDTIMNTTGDYDHAEAEAQVQLLIGNLVKAQNLTFRNQ